MLIKLIVVLMVVGVSLGNQHHPFTSQVEQALKSKRLPNNFATIFEKTSDGKYLELGMGALIYPGAILAHSLARHRDKKYHKDPYDLYYSDKHFKALPTDNIYVGFRNNPDSLEYEKIKVDLIRISERSSYYFYNYSIMYFEPTPGMAHITPIPMVNSGDFQSFADFTGQDLLTVGYQKYTCEEGSQCSSDSATTERMGKISACSEKTRKQGTPYLIKRKMLFGPKEAELMSLLVKYFPGKLEEFIQDAEETKPEGLSFPVFTPMFDRPLRDPSRKFYELIHCFPFCLSSFHATTEESQDKGFCQESKSTGYPVLWQTKTGDYKMMGIGLTKIAFRAINNSILQNEDHHMVGLDILRFLPWIQSDVRNYREFSGKTEEPLVLEHPHYNNYYQKKIDSIVRVNTVPSGSSGGGVYLGDGVVLTAAHVAEDAFNRQKNNELEISFLLQGERVRYTANTIVIHPKYHENGLHDLALVFFDEPDDFPNIQPAEIVDSRTSLTDLINSGSKIFKVAYRGFNEKRFFLQDYETPYSKIHPAYWLLPATYISNIHQALIDYYEDELVISSSRFENILLPYVQSITGIKHIKETVVSKLANAIDQKEMFWSSQCSRPSRLCLTAEKKSGYLDELYFGCSGDSGSPVFIESQDGSSVEVFAVTSGVLMKYPVASFNCSFLLYQESLFYHRPWVDQTIQEHKKWPRSILKKVIDFLFSD
ncbi:MAG: trypsin-like serine protease [Proteobacteria bacterium]|nr:trypsin-like serine protease [Pseudomonadota bacterium]